MLTVLTDAITGINKPNIRKREMQQKMRFPFRVSRDCLGRCFVFVRHSLSCFHRNRVAF